MNWTKWKNQYENIVKSLNLTFDKDHEAGRILNGLLDEHEVEKTIENIKDLIDGKICYIFGCGPSLEKNIKKIKYKLNENITIISADGATTALLNHGIIPHVILSDLDGNIEKIREANQKGSYLMIHGHGDNIQLLKKHAKDFSYVIGTVQIEPFGKLKNFGGFTDGDRCVFLADHFNAQEIFLFGFDFGNMVGKYSKIGHDNDYLADEVKKKKLEIANNLVKHLKENSSIRISNWTNRI